jgi:hypothetical protein
MRFRFTILDLLVATALIAIALLAFLTWREDRRIFGYTRPFFLGSVEQQARALSSCCASHLFWA